MNKCCQNCGYLNKAVEGLPDNTGRCTAPLPDWVAVRFPLGVHPEFRNVLVGEGTTCPTFTPAAPGAL